MKSPRLLLLPVVLMSFSTLALAQSDPATSFSKLKALAGTWEGQVKTIPSEPSIEGKTTTVTLRVTSMGHTLMHEVTTPGRPDDPITMFYLDGDRLFLTHYCDANNRPRMVGKMSPDGKTVDFDFLDVAGNLKYGHMQHGTFTFVDANHHTEEWTFLLPGDKPVRALLDLQRTK
jgi:hypothetical protein